MRVITKKKRKIFTIEMPKAEGNTFDWAAYKQSLRKWRVKNGILVYE